MASNVRRARRYAPLLGAGFGLALGWAVLTLFTAPAAHAGDAEHPDGSNGLLSSLTAEVTEPVGDLLGSVVSPVTTHVTEPLSTQVVEPVSEVVAPVAEAVAPVTAPVVDAVVPVAAPVIAPVTDTLDPVLAPVTDAVAPVLAPLAAAVAPVATPVVDAVAPVLGAGTGDHTSPPPSGTLPAAPPASLPDPVTADTAVQTDPATPFHVKRPAATSPETRSSAPVAQSARSLLATQIAPDHASSEPRGSSAPGLATLAAATASALSPGSSGVFVAALFALAGFALAAARSRRAMTIAIPASPSFGTDVSPD